MRKIILAASAASFLCAPASATEWLTCSDASGSADVGLLLGTAGGFGAVAATMRNGDERWVTDPAYGEGVIFTVGQGFADDTGIKADFYDGNINERVAELRLNRAEEGDTIALAGTLRIIGQGAWAISCEAQ